MKGKLSSDGLNGEDLTVTELLRKAQFWSEVLHF